MVAAAATALLHATGGKRMNQRQANAAGGTDTRGPAEGAPTAETDDGGSLLLDLSAPSEAAALAMLAKTAATALRDTAGVDLACTVAIRRPKRRPVTAGSAERAVALTEWDLEKSHGPASESLEGHVAILVNAHSRDPRWPNYRERLRASGYLSAASLPLTLDHGYAGALTLLAAESNVFTTLLMADVVQFRDMAARSLRLATQVRRASEFSGHLRSALSHRSAIDIACGVIMAQNRCSYEEAIAILVAASSHRNIKLRHIAESILEGYGGPP